MGAAELAAGAIRRPRSSPLFAVGAGFIDLTPVWLKDFAIRHFGTNDKTVLLSGLAAGLVVAAIAVGLLARRWRWAGLAGLACFGLVGLVAALTRPTAAAVDALPAVVGTAAGMLALLVLLRASTPAAVTDGEHRRRLLLAGAGTVAFAAASAAGGRLLMARTNVAALRARVRLPVPAPSNQASSVPLGAQVPLAGMPRFTTPNNDFYRVDTALLLPQVDPGGWTLRVHGMVARPMEITFDELLRRPLIERDITLACVSNEVGGRLAGNARWLGVPLAALLREAGVESGADQLLSRSADGMTLGTPLDAVLDGRDALLAVGMNGEPLPIAHGFPARMVVPGLYGYVSATKWVVDLKVTRFATDRAYWRRRGYAEQAPVKTFSRIDVPAPLAKVSAGRVMVAGTAWAQHRGVAAVQVQVDDGPWREARLAPVPGLDTWRQWVIEWNAVPGSHTLRVRATDGTGATQPQERARPFPDGATGWHSVVITVT
ncbi:molybdopterin-dependent oxidoreductase [Actinomadura barringtoniae]|uniref:Molybdopterin-dependent oxidoreductase n=1 Tax=Actinomadura barringtoniae TaxID=1427535 RepID=A0A939TC65_9ACTN|nr:molybdopterin-dependent oxidoreductase [Actinomadura barringtoniae]